MTLRTVEEAAEWVEQVGIALLYPKPDIVLPSLWEAVAGRTEIDWAIREDDGSFVSFTPEMERVWRWKDDLPAQQLACVGLHVVRTTGLVAPKLVGAIYALTGRRGTPEDFRDEELEPLDGEIAEAALELGRPTTRRELRVLVNREKRDVDKAVNVLQRKLVLTNAGRDDEGSGWSSTLHDVFARRWRRALRRLPRRDEALHALSENVVRAAGDVSAADLAAALRLRRREAAEILEALEQRGRLERADDGGIAIWVAARSLRSRRGRPRDAVTDPAQNRH